MLCEKETSWKNKKNKIKKKRKRGSLERIESEYWRGAMREKI